MEAILLQYGWVLIVLVVLEGLLAADNAVVMAVMVKHLPQEQQKGVILWTIWGTDFPILRAVCYYGIGELLANTSGRCCLSIVYVCEKYI